MTGDYPIERPGRSGRLIDALDAVWSTMADDYGLLPDLAADAVMVRAAGELAMATPRLLELLVHYELTISEAADVVTRLGNHRWSGSELSVIQEVLDAWWSETLMSEPGEHTEPYGPEVVLGVLAGFDAPMVRWFGPWIAELDGPGSQHLATIIVNGRDALTESAWVGKEDRADQLFGWARSETVVHGLALIGATHLDPEMLSDALDRLI